MTMHQPAGQTSGRQAAMMMLAIVLGLLGTTVGVVILLSKLGAPERQAAPAPAGRPPSAPAVLPTGQAPSAAMTRPLPVPPQGRQASARRAQDGQFYFDTALNGASIRMMFDTGASAISLRAEDAARAGIAVNALNYSITVNTANGTTTAAPVMLDTVRVGDVTRRNVLAIVSRPGQLGVSLLGQTFMSKLSGYRFERGELILQGD